MTKWNYIGNNLWEWKTKRRRWVTSRPDVPFPRYSLKWRILDTIIEFRRDWKKFLMSRVCLLLILLYYPYLLGKKGINRLICINNRRRDRHRR